MSVLLGTSRAARRRMTAWQNENEGCFWAVKLDVRDLGGHLDVTLRALAGTLSSRDLQQPPLRSLQLEPSPWGFNECLGWCAQNICLVGFMVVRVLSFLSAHLVHFELRLPERSGLKKLP